MEKQYNKRKDPYEYNTIKYLKERLMCAEMRLTDASNMIAENTKMWVKYQKEVMHIKESLDRLKERK